MSDSRFPLPLAPLALASGLVLASSSAFAVDYLTAEQARKALFPAAASWQEASVLLSPEQLQALAKAAQLPARSVGWKLAHAFDANHRYLGSVVVDNVVGKFELITYAVGMDARGAVAGIEVLSYRESHGGEIRLPAWRQQFVGKTAAQPLRVGDDIAGLSGATLSCTHVTDGVRRIVALWGVLRDAKTLPA